jgi:hypothetical protein
MKYRLTDLLSSLGHAALASCVFAATYGALKLLGVHTAQWIALGFPAGLYYGREVLDQQRNIYEDFKRSMPSEKARALSQRFRYAFFYGWDLDGILDVVFPWTALVTLAVLATIFL